jgi:hypothetical protein
MQINIQKLYGIVAGVIATGIVGFASYLGYVVFFTGPVAETSPSLATVNVSSFSAFPKIAKTAGAVSGGGQKILIGKKDYLFTEKPLFKSFVDEPVDVPLSDKRGRPDPFVPYVP